MAVTTYACRNPHFRSLHMVARKGLTDSQHKSRAPAALRRWLAPRRMLGETVEPDARAPIRAAALTRYFAPYTSAANRFIGRGDQTVRAALVEHNWDKVGLLAMAIYEQHRRDWIQNYLERFGQAPDEYACEVFDLAEHTRRRLAAYRQLSEARLAQSVSPAPVGATESFLTRYYRADPDRRRKTSRRWI